MREREHRNLFDEFKEKLIGIITSRLTVFTVIFCLFAGVLIYRCFELQIVHGQEYLEEFVLEIEKTRDIASTRGNIYDRNGNVLAYNELAYSVKIEDVFESGRLKNSRLNDTIYSLIQMIEKNGADPETGLGLVTDVCLKRKIRNYVETVKDGAEGFRIYVKDNVPLNRSDAEAFTELDVTEKTVKARKKDDPDLDKKLRDWMCLNFFDIRTFGAVMTTFTKNALNCGQVRGPVQLSFAQSVEPVVPQEVTITRVAITTEADAERKGTEMGRKYIVPYGLYRCEGYISANLARKTTGFSEEDLALLWESILNMFEHDHSAARGKMAVRELIVFKHDTELGCAPAYKLFESVTIRRKKPDESAPARSYQDYVVEVNESALPAGITCTRMG